MAGEVASGRGLHGAEASGGRPGVCAEGCGGGVPHGAGAVTFKLGRRVERWGRGDQPH